MPEQFLSPTGYYIVKRQEAGRDTWIVRVLDFATWKHRLAEFPDESSATAEVDRWRI